jgi:hypothetical protein
MFKWPRSPFAINIIIWPLRSNIPAVKIADAPTLPLLPKSDDSIANVSTPESCVSGVAKATPTQFPIIKLVTTKLAPIDSSLFSVKQEGALPPLLAVEDHADEFGEFLLDAVQWL